MPLTTEGKKWCAAYITVSCLSSISNGATSTVVGPSQLYLAKNVGVDIDTINLMWTFGFVGFLLGALFTGMVFKQYMRSTMAKVGYVGGVLALTGVLMAAIPFATSFPLLLALRFGQLFMLSSKLTSDSSMIVYTMGPVTSRPYTSAMHAFIGVGFLVGSFLVRSFLPGDETTDRKKTEAVCGGEDVNVTVDEDDGHQGYTVEYVGGIDTVAWPFLISGGMCLVGSLLFILVGCLPMKMPRFLEDQEGAETNSAPRIHYWKSVVMSTTLYFSLSCGIERIFMSMIYTYALCGPLALPPTDAVIADVSYSGGFMTGRLVSIFMAKLTKPRNIIITACAGCTTAAILLCIFGGTSKYGLYTCCAMMGLFVSIQFGAAYSWLAQKMDITGRLAPISYFGCGLGSTLTPPLTGFVFTYFGKSSAMLYVNLVTCTLQSFTFVFMWTMARKKNSHGA